MPKTLTALAATAVLLLGACGASGTQDEQAATTTDAGTEETTTTTSGATTTTESNVADGATDVDDWAEDFCGSFEGWISNIQDASAEVGADIEPGDIQGGKDAIVNLFELASAQTENLVSDIEAGGVPDVEDGDKLVDDLTSKFNDFNAAIEEAKTQAEAIPIDDAAAFQAKITELTGTFETEVLAVGESFSELDAKYPSRELQSALSSSCDI